MTSVSATLSRTRSAATEAPSADVLLGRRVAGRYDIVKHLATGGMASVYEAIDTRAQTRVALKILHPHHARRPTILRRFQLEASLLSKLDARYIAVARDSGHCNGVHYLVMDLLVGHDLRQLLQRCGRLSIPLAVDMALDVCRGLGSAHARGLVHRDIKPSNIFIAKGDDGGCHAKLLDFGIAKHVTWGDSTDESSLLGTVGYMAPEQVVSSKRVDHRADLYSLGVALYEALNGTPAYGGDRTEVLYEIVHGRSLSVEDFDRQLPRGLVQAIVKATAREPDERHRDVQALAIALAPFAGHGFLRSDPADAATGPSGALGDERQREEAAAEFANTQPDPSSEGHALEPVEGRRGAPPGRRRRSALTIITVAAASATATLAPSSEHQPAPPAPPARASIVAPLEPTRPSEPPEARALPKPGDSSPQDGIYTATESMPPQRTLDAAPRGAAIPSRNGSSSRARLPPASTSDRTLGEERSAIRPGVVFASDNPYDAR